MKFSAPILLVTLLAAPALAVLVLRDERLRRLRLSRLVDLGLTNVLVAGASDRRRRARAALAIVAITIAAIAAAAPLWPSAPRLLPRRGLDVLFVIDVSRSMRARDVRPDRLERAKAEIAAALPALAEQRTGVVAFAGTAFVQCPLTTDAEAVRLFLRDLDPNTIPQGGTALVDGLEVARNAFVAEDEARGAGTTEVGKAGRIVVVVSDGEDHALLDGEGKDDLKEVGTGLKGLGASVVVIGVGSALGEPIPMTNERGEITGYVKDRRGQTVLTRMSPEVLGAVAEALSGRFVDGTTAPDLGLNEVLAVAASLEKRDLEARTIVDYDDATAPLCALALVLMLSWLSTGERSTQAATRRPT